MKIINILELVSFLILLITFILLFIWSLSNLNKKTRLTQVPKSVFREINEILNLKKDSVFYNLGSGDARFLFYLLSHNQDSEFIGVESNYFLIKLAKIHNWWNSFLGKKKIKIIKKDILESSFSEATHVFTYIYPDIMDDLLPRLDDELKPGTILISLNFRFTNKIPIKEIDLNKKRYSLKYKLYVYEF